MLKLRLSLVAEHPAMKRAGIILFQFLVTAAGLWYVFHDPQRGLLIGRSFGYDSSLNGTREIDKIIVEQFCQHRL